LTSFFVGLNKCLIRNKNKNETLLVNVSNSTVKNIFENGMIPKLILTIIDHNPKWDDKREGKRKLLDQKT
jgi:hypothetical protein